MREAFNIIGKIVVGTATAKDRQRLEHLCANKAAGMKRPINVKKLIRDRTRRATEDKP